MIDAVLTFGLMNVLFELVVLGMMPPRFRLRVLGRESWSRTLHIVCLLLNLTIHWGTLVGTMSGIMAFIASIVTVQFARVVWGGVDQQMNYRVGLIKYGRKELV